MTAAGTGVASPGGTEICGTDPILRPRFRLFGQSAGHFASYQQVGKTSKWKPKRSQAHFSFLTWHLRC